MSSSVSFDKLRIVRRIKILGYIFLFTGVLLGVVFVVFAYVRPKAAGVFIETNPISTVYINGEEKGSTPYKENFSPDEITVKLVPTESAKEFVSYETKVRLVPGVETTIRHDFSSDEDTSATEIISFERIENNNSSLSIVTIPEDAKILIDGRDRAFSPYKTSALIAGEHNILITENGYQDRVIKMKTHDGYNLTLFVDLAALVADLPQQNPEPTTAPNQQVRILSTELGFLRVRSSPGLNGLELATVDPGDVYDLVQTEQENGWYLIEYSPGETGWVSSNYVEIIGDAIEESSEATGSADI